MEVFVLLLNHTEYLSPVLQAMQDAGFRGATIADCTGMLRELDASFDVDAPELGLLRHYHSQERSKCKLVYAVIDESRREELLAIVNRITGGLEQVDAGIAFGIPLTGVVGLSPEKLTGKIGKKKKHA